MLAKTTQLFVLMLKLIIIIYKNVSLKISDCYRKILKRQNLTDADDVINHCLFFLIIFEF